jgi:phosphatidylinositol alpha-1,6-mannosyltransferase
MKTVLFVSAGLGVDGGGTALVGRLLLRIAEEAAEEQGSAVKVFNLGEGVPSRTGHAVNFCGSQARLGMAVYRAMFAEDICAVLFDFLGPARTQSFIPPPFRRPYLVFLHGVEAWRHLNWQRRSALENASILICNSHYTKARAKEWSPWLPDISPVGLALEERECTETPDQRVLAEAGSGFALIVGRMASGERYKGHESLLLAMQQVAESNPQAKLVVVGDGDDRQRLEAVARDMGLEERVVFTGFISEATLKALYERCGFFTLPSRDEGFGLVYLEAMRAGKACIGIKGGAVEEIVDGEQTGILVPYGAPEPLAQAMKRLFVDQDLRLRLGRGGRTRWERHFRFEHFRARCLPHVRALLSHG